MAEVLWTRLRDLGLYALAPTLFEHGVRSLEDILPNAAVLVASGVSAAHLEAILRGRHELPPVLEAFRADHPVVLPRARASWAAALEAALPINRERALAALRADVLAATSRPAVESRLRAWYELCRAWEVPPFPVTAHTVQCVGASLKAGHYHSCSQYFSAAIAHQLRTLKQPIGEEVRWAIRDAIRSVKRGLGPASLKDSFDVRILGGLVSPDMDLEPFSWECIQAAADIVLVACWFMLREIELSAAKARHLYLEGRDRVNLLLPVSKTDVQGQLTVRTYRCICRAQNESLCPYHAAKRHLDRLDILKDQGGVSPFLLPGQGTDPVSKATVVRMVERVLHAAGVPLTRPDAAGHEIARFRGHVLRVSGTQFLASLGIGIPLLQLQGRWTSRAIERYAQLAPLLRLPDSVLAACSMVPGPEQQACSTSGEGGLVVVDSPLSEEGEGPSRASERPAKRRARRSRTPSRATEEFSTGVAPWADEVQDLRDQLAVLRAAISEPPVTYVVQPRRGVVHEVAVNEAHNEVGLWRTSCGWAYGWSSFYRVTAQGVGSGLRRCKRCFSAEALVVASSSDSSSSSSSSESSASS